MSSGGNYDGLWFYHELITARLLHVSIVQSIVVVVGSGRLRILDNHFVRWRHNFVLLRRKLKLNVHGMSFWFRLFKEGIRSWQCPTVTFARFVIVGIIKNILIYNFDLSPTKVIHIHIRTHTYRYDLCIWYLGSAPYKVYFSTNIFF